MRFPIGVAFAAAAAVLVSAQDDGECEADFSSVDTTSAATVDTSSVTTNKTTTFTPVPAPDVNTDAIGNVVPSTNITLHYGSNDTSVPENSSFNITNTMKYPAVILEQIAAVANVTCTDDSVIVGFSNATVFAAARSEWSSAVSNLVFVTNHLGNCDVELERGWFLVNDVAFDDSTLSATASCEKSDIASTAASTEIRFGGLDGTVPLSKRTTLEPSYTINTDIALPADTVLFSDAPYVTVTAESASVSVAVTSSGYLKYNWLLIKLEDLYFDVDTNFDANLVLDVDVTASFSKTFSYSPDALTYSLVDVPGILQLGPAVKLGLGATLSVDAAVNVTTDVGLALADGNVHLDLLDSSNTGTSGWDPTYTTDLDISGKVVADVNPFVALTVEIAIVFFSGLLDLSTGLTAKPGFNNTITLTGSGDVSLSGVTGTTSNGTCAEGLELKSEFFFGLDAFATEWYTTTLYSVDVPLFDKCWSWA